MKKPAIIKQKLLINRLQMSDPEKEIINIILKLDENSIFSLEHTVTQGLKKSEAINEAIHNIIKHSPDYISILRRKVLTRDILFNYLEENNIKVRLPTTKNELIDTIADAWKISRLGTQSQENAVSKIPSSNLPVQNSQDNSGITQMAKQFSKWFYSMLNLNECGAEHFFPDAKLKLNLYCSDDCESTEVDNNPDDISKALLQIKFQHNLHFNLNETQDGIQGRTDPHGLVLVLACGTLHTQNICTGVFEQIFALARDPFSENNWKIKNTQLNLKSKNNILQYPTLSDSTLTSGLLQLPYE